MSIGIDLLESPMAQFECWFQEVLQVETSDPTAMVLSTTDVNGCPDSRVVLLKEFTEGTFIFYTNYESTKGVQIQNNPNVALNFYWPVMARQVRILGQAAKVPASQSDAYFASRPRNSQLSAIVSPQSSVITSRAELLNKIQSLASYYDDKPIPRSDNWGGYAVRPTQMEFWQGREHRLHDRVQYKLQNNTWSMQRLAP